MDVSVIIVNYKTSQLIINSLESLFRHTHGLSYEIIVADNASDPTFDKKIKASFPDFPLFKFIKLKENIGFGLANNEGIKQASGRNIFFLNPDTILLNNAMGILANFLDSHPNAGACGGNLYSETMQPNLSFRRILPGIRWDINELLNGIPEKLLFGNRSKFETSEMPCKVGYITGADLMVKKEVLNITGYFSHEFFMYYEETDLCARIKAIRKDIFCVPDAHIQHLDGKSFNDESLLNHFKIEIIEKSRAAYYRLHLSRSQKIIANSIYNLYLKSRIFLLPKGTKKEYYRLRHSFFQKYKFDQVL